MDIIVEYAGAHRGQISAPVAGIERAPCALGKAGVTADKREGDHATPLGCFGLRRLWYRPDREAAPACALPITAIARNMGWSDAIDDPRYNRLVTRPHSFSHEKLWRRDGLYNLFFELAINDDPPIAGRGSALFLHLAKRGFKPTEGCVAIERDILLRLAAHVAPQSRITIRA